MALNLTLLSVEGLEPAEANRRLRIQLAGVHRGLSQLKMVDRVFNHLSAMAPAANGKGEVMLVTPFPIDFGKVTPSSLLGVDVASGDVVEGGSNLHPIPGSFHRGIYLQRPSTKAVVHVHSPYACVLACLENPRLMGLHFASRVSFGIAYEEDFGGIVDDLKLGEKIAKLLGKDKHTALLRNHGAVFVGNSVQQAFNYAVMLEMSVKLQVRALSTGLPLREIPREMLRQISEKEEKLATQGIFAAHLLTFIQEAADTDQHFCI